MNNFKITGKVLHISPMSRKSVPFIYGIINSATEKNGKVTSSLNMPFIAFEDIAEQFESLNVVKGVEIVAEGYLKERTYKEQRQIQFAIQKFSVVGAIGENDFDIDYASFEKEEMNPKKESKVESGNPFANEYNPFD